MNLKFQTILDDIFFQFDLFPGRLIVRKPLTISGLTFLTNVDLIKAYVYVMNQSHRLFDKMSRLAM